MVWVTTRRVRALAVKCGFDPPLGMTRKVLLQMIEDFRLGREGGVLGEELLQGDAPAPIVLDEDGVDEVELARLRELEEAELLILIEESDRENELAAEFEATRKRKAESDALSASHAARMVSLRARLSDSRGANTNLRPLSCPIPLPLPLPLPHLTASKAARMDRGVARPPPRQVQPYRLAPAPPPQCVEPPGDMWDGCDPHEVHTRNARCFLACSRSLKWLYGFRLCLSCRKFLPHVADGRSVSLP